MFVNPFNKSVTVLDGRVTVHDESAIASPAMDKLVYTAVFGEPDDREPGNAGLHVRLDLDLPRLETDESMSDRACEHPFHGRREGAT